MPHNQHFLFQPSFTILLLLSSSLISEQTVAKAPSRLTPPAVVSAVTAAATATVATVAKQTADNPTDAAKRAVTITLPDVTEIQANVDAKLDSLKQIWDYIQHESFVAPAVQFLQTTEGKSTALFILISSWGIIAARARQRQLQARIQELEAALKAKQSATAAV